MQFRANPFRRRSNAAATSLEPVADVYPSLAAH